MFSNNNLGVKVAINFEQVFNYFCKQLEKVFDVK
jgi:hypothetical protein